MFISQASDAQKDNVVKAIEAHLGPIFSHDSLCFALDGYDLPDDLLSLPFEEMEDELLHDISIWLFMRFVARAPKLNFWGEIHVSEAASLADAMTAPNWRELSADPVSLGWLPSYVQT